MRQMVALIAIVAAALAGCGQAGDSTARSSPSDTAAASPRDADSPTATPSTSAGRSARGTVITSAASAFGDMLVDDTGQAIYLFAKENTVRPECYDACAQAWPPVLTKGLPRGAGDVRESLLGTVDRTDGSQQVTYGGHPLYYYAHEGKNQVLCHNVNGFGGLWLVVTPKGTPAPA